MTAGTVAPGDGGARVRLRRRVLSAVRDAALDGDALAAILWVGLLRLSEQGVADWMRRRLGPAEGWLRPETGLMVGAGRVVIDPADMPDAWRPAFDPREPSDPAILLAVPAPQLVIAPEAARPRVLIDLLALCPNDPARWRAMTGHAELLGARPADYPGDAGWGAPYRLYRHPLGWLEAGAPLRAAGCALDVDRFATLYGEELVAVCDDPAHAAEWAARRKALLRPKRPPLPEIRIPATAARAAA